jgi:hypothetical protein
VQLRLRLHAELRVVVFTWHCVERASVPPPPPPFNAAAVLQQHQRAHGDYPMSAMDADALTDRLRRDTAAAASRWGVGGSAVRAPHPRACEESSSSSWESTKREASREVALGFHGERNAWRR